MAIAVRFWVRLPVFTPRHCISEKATMTAHAIREVSPLEIAKRIVTYSPITIAARAALLHVDSQSLHPITKPA